MGPNVTLPVRQAGDAKFTATKEDNQHYSAVTRWVVAFLTKRGSRKVMRNFGTDFLVKLRMGAARDADAFKTLFNRASASAIQATQSDMVVNVASVTLRQFTISEDRVQMLLDFSFSDGTVGVRNIEVG